MESISVIMPTRIRIHIHMRIHARVHSTRCYCFLCFYFFVDIDLEQFYFIFVTLGIILESFWCHFGVLRCPGAPKGSMVEEKRNQTDFGRHLEGIPP